MNAKTKKIFLGIVAVVVSACIFVAAFFIGRATESHSAQTLNWIWSTAQKNYYKELDEDTFFKNYNAGGITNALDAYSAYYTKAQYAALLSSNSGNKSGVGLSYSYVKGHPDGGDGILITMVMGNSPAYYAGIRKGALLKSGTASGQTVYFNSASAFVSFLNKQPTDTQFVLTDADGKNYTLAMEEYTASYAFMATKTTSWHYQSAASGGLALYEDASGGYDFLPNGFAYLNVSQFFGTAAGEVGYLIEKFNETVVTDSSTTTPTLILDLRSNGGGYVQSMQDMAGYFTANVQNASTVAMYCKYRSGNMESFAITARLAEEGLASGTNVYVLANSGTASASEALIGVLVTCGLVPYSHIYLSEFGEAYMNYYLSMGYTADSLKSGRSYGKGIMQSTFTNLSTGEALKLTTAEIFWPDGTTSIHNKGLRTELGCKTVSAAWTATKNDEELKAAIADIVGGNS